MTERDQIISIIDRMLDEKVIDYWGRPIKLCDTCGGSSSVEHQNIWCNKCPGKMIDFPDMTWRNLFNYIPFRRTDFVYHLYAECCGYTSLEVVSDLNIIKQMMDWEKEYKISDLIKSRLD